MKKAILIAIGIVLVVAVIFSGVALFTHQNATAQGDKCNELVCPGGDPNYCRPIAGCACDVNKWICVNGNGTG